MERHYVCSAEELPPGARKSVTVGNRSLGVFNVDGSYYAVRDRCPHQGAPLCRGTVGGRITAKRPYEYSYAEDEHILRCPWHGWEFELASGKSLFDPERVRVKTYDVILESGDIFIVV